MSAPDPSLLSLNTVTVKRQWNLAQAIDGCARHGIRGISAWRDQVAEMGIKNAVSSIRKHGLTVTGLCRGGFFTSKDWLDDNRRAIEEAHELQAQCLVLVVGGLPSGSRDLMAARQQIKDSIQAILPEARKAGVPLAIEPLHPMQAADRACVNTLEHALDLCDALGEDERNAQGALGVAVDVYHVWWDPKLEAQVKRAGKKRLLAYHICDWRVPTRDLLNDRAMMGDGVIDLPKIRAWVEGAGYTGFHEVEIFSELDWWKRDPDEVLATCKERHARCT
ncbi:MAG TPA: sugar phosphate isomerase/epimerase family protein [Burkholderiales bacterium]|nr:sugar phosphate isomerase/epimerase family protein [Burkholderiales bacterium]